MRGLKGCLVAASILMAVFITCGFAAGQSKPAAPITVDLPLTEPPPMRSPQ